MTSNGGISSEKPITIFQDEKKHKRRRYKVGDPDFVPPDGGWGWFIVFACGFSNLCTFPMFQQFGLIFGEKFLDIGITNTQTTTVTNMNSAFNASVGLLNGPLFRKFTYRQVAMFGSCLVATSLFLTLYCKSFWGYIILYSMFYGSGIGITQSSNALALNTYFKEKRRIATGLSWTTTALGPIVWPYIITYLMQQYAMEGTLMLFSAFALHAFMCSLLLHPVEWHTKFRNIENLEPEEQKLLNGNGIQININDNTKLAKASKTKSIFSSQYLHNEDDNVYTGYEITDPGTPMMLKANDGWYSQSRSQVGSRLSLSSNKTNKGQQSLLPSTQNSAFPSARPSFANLQDARGYKNSFTPQKRERRASTSKPPKQEKIEEEKQTNGNSYPNEKEILKTAAKKLEEYKTEIDEKQKQIVEHEDEHHEKIGILKKISIFFDFELFKDKTYVNLMLGITIANFAELNFSILTPMILKEFGFAKYETATFMSLLGATDILVRFCVPFLAGKIGWDNKTFFLVGVLSMAFGRIILVHTQTYHWSLLVAVIIGAGKGLRTIFMALVIPTYVPLERLPAASGIQLATSGLFFIILGPAVGWIRDAVQNYTITLHLLNICTYTTTIAWTLDHFISRSKRKEKSVPC